MNSFGAVFGFFDTVKVAGMSLTTWIIIALVVSAIALFIRGNK